MWRTAASVSWISLVFRKTYYIRYLVWTHISLLPIDPILRAGDYSDVSVSVLAYGVQCYRNLIDAYFSDVTLALICGRDSEI